MAILAGIPILAFTVILQSTVFSRVPLLSGPLDLVVVVLICWTLNERVKDEWTWALIGGSMVGFVSELPLPVPIFSYLLVTAVSVYLKRRIWQVPVLALFVTTVLGTLIVYAASYLVLTVLGTSLPIFEVLNLIVLPSLLLNLLAALPVNGLIGEVAAFLNPEELE
jgi:rod shape-determining protein MreD